MVQKAGKKRVYCLKVKPLFVETYYGMYHAGRVQPLFCHCAFHDELVSQVLSLRERLIEEGFHQITQCLPEARWFYELSQRYHHEVKSFINVTEKAVFLTGFLPPFDEPHFQTCKIPIAELLLNPGQFKHADPVVDVSPLVKSLIAEIEAKDAELGRRLEQSYALDRLGEAMSELDEVTAVINVDLDTHQDLLRKEVDSFTQAVEQLEQEIEALNMRLLYQCLKVQSGDWVSSDVARGKKLQLVVESASYSDGWLFIRGANITQKGEVGKRVESFTIEISQHEH
ncbi:putative orphan protein [Photobacterium sp. SKA34]|uniref:hypothetical protein n=1 Tax=Photobacterium sp. SKA34 TaxID=121723 RepID=UPI00006BEB32|nr:hypothetical protein [Photobacterium sp. SKA34]EAR55869.1 putative orphan protein [Photobacterium sp. SKA34]